MVIVYGVIVSLLIDFVICLLSIANIVDPNEAIRQSIIRIGSFLLLAIVFVTIA